MFISLLMGIISGAFGGAVGFVFTRLLVEGLDVVDGPPAGVLLVLTCGFMALGSGALGFVSCFRWLHKHPVEDDRKS